MVKYVVLLLLAAYLASRVRERARKLMPLGQDLTNLVYLITLVLFFIVLELVPRWTVKGLALCGLVWFAVSFAVSYKLHQRYNARLEETERGEEEENG